MHRAPSISFWSLRTVDEAFLFERSIDIDTYDRHAGRVREQMTLLKIDEHTSKLEELHVEGIMLFAERVLPCRGPLTCGCKARSINGSACSCCSSRRESRSTVTAFLEPR